MKRTFAFLLTMFLFSTTFVVPAYANSAVMQWSGMDSTGAIVVDENCPIEVEKEVLTFDIAEFCDHFPTKEALLAYSSKVTAEYTFYNPTDQTVTATLAFPFGQKPHYAIVYDWESDEFLTDLDTEKYDITVNGQVIEKTTRYTLKGVYSQFNLSEDLHRLSDTYLSDGFYSPTMAVTTYTYLVGGANKDGLIDEEKYPAANIAFDWDGGDGSTRIYCPEVSGFYTQKNGDFRLSAWAENGDTFSVHVIGQPLATPPEWSCYEDGGVMDKDKISGTVEMINVETTTLEEFVLANWQEDLGVSKVDWYNAVICALEESREENILLEDDYGVDISAESFMNSLMRWYEYEITIGPKESIVNTVTAPLYPGANVAYEPAIYTYSYLLSPASMWASFGELEIVINTPFYITESSLEGFTKTDTGYTLKHNGLPEGEFEFTMSSSENPTRQLTGLEYIIGYGTIAGVILVIGGGIMLFIVFRKPKKAKNNQA